MSGQGSLTPARRRAGAWTYRYGVSAVVFGYGISVGLYRESVNVKKDWLPVLFFRSHAYRGPFS